MLRLFTTIATFVFFTLLAAFAAFAQDGGRDPEISIGSCYGNFNCTGPSSDVLGRAKGPQHVGCNGVINKFAVYAVCTSGDCSSQCSPVKKAGGFQPGLCISSINMHDPVGWVKL